MSKYSSSESCLKIELLRRNTNPEVAEIRVTKRKAKRGEQAVKVVFALLRLLHNPAMRRYTPCLRPNKPIGRSLHKALFRHVTHHCDLKSMLQTSADNGRMHSFLFWRTSTQR